MRGTAEVTRSAQPGEEQTEGRSHHNLQESIVREGGAGTDLCFVVTMTGPKGIAWSCSGEI